MIMSLSAIAPPDWLPSVRAVIVLAIVQEGPRDIVQLLTACRKHVHDYQSGQCSGAITTLINDGTIYCQAGLYHITTALDDL
jgi:hypothetical protein